MDKIDQLIKSLEDLKQELEKNVNGSYSAPPNEVAQSEKEDSPEEKSRKKKRGWMEWEMGRKGEATETLECSENGQWNLLEKDAVNPKLAPKDVKVKQLQAQIDAGTYKPDASKIADAMKKHPEKPLQKTKPAATSAAPKLPGHSADPEVKADWTQNGHKSVFSMDHVSQVASMKSHDNAKVHAHNIVDNSNAKDETKQKLKAVINSSKSPAHLAGAMSNHILSHQGLNVIGAKKPKSN